MFGFSSHPLADRSSGRSPFLVDIAIKGLSPAINDPTTAVQASNQIEGLLILLGNADLETGKLYDI
jgi:hypothetical protein